MKALWVDNALSYLEPYRSVLIERDWQVDIASSASEGERLLRRSAAEPYDLLILDVVMPTLTNAEEAAYPPYSTDSGIETGFARCRRAVGCSGILVPDEAGA